MLAFPQFHSGSVGSSLQPFLSRHTERHSNRSQLTPGRSETGPLIEPLPILTLFPTFLDFPCPTGIQELGHATYIAI